MNFFLALGIYEYYIIVFLINSAATISREALLPAWSTCLDCLETPWKPFFDMWWSGSRLRRSSLPKASLHLSTWPSCTGRTTYWGKSMRLDKGVGLCLGIAEGMNTLLFQSLFRAAAKDSRALCVSYVIASTCNLQVKPQVRQNASFRNRCADPSHKVSRYILQLKKVNVLLNGWNPADVRPLAALMFEYHRPPGNECRNKDKSRNDCCNRLIPNRQHLAMPYKKRFRHFQIKLFTFHAGWTRNSETKLNII